MPIHSTAGWRAATSPRNSPTRPAPMMARPSPLADFLKARSLHVRDLCDRLVRQRQVHWLVDLRREVGRCIGLHHHPGMRTGDHGWPVEDAVFEEMDGSGPICPAN